VKHREPPQNKDQNTILALQNMNRTLHKRIEELLEALEAVDSEIILTGSLKDFVDEVISKARGTKATTITQM
jgi:hypothetical protein